MSDTGSPGSTAPSSASARSDRANELGELAEKLASLEGSLQASQERLRKVKEEKEAKLKRVQEEEDRTIERAEEEYAANDATKQAALREVHLRHTLLRQERQQRVVELQDELDRVLKDLADSEAELLTIRSETEAQRRELARQAETDELQKEEADRVLAELEGEMGRIERNIAALYKEKQLTQDQKASKKEQRSSQRAKESERALKDDLRDAVERVSRSEAALQALQRQNDELSTVRERREAELAQIREQEAEVLATRSSEFNLERERLQWEWKVHTLEAWEEEQHGMCVSGTLLRSGGVFASWQRRWCCINGDYMWYNVYMPSKGRQQSYVLFPTTAIDEITKTEKHDSATIIPPPTTAASRKLAFAVQAKGRTHHFCAETKESFKMWWDTLNRWKRWYKINTHPPPGLKGTSPTASGPIFDGDLTQASPKKEASGYGSPVSEKRRPAPRSWSPAGTSSASVSGFSGYRHRNRLGGSFLSDGVEYRLGGRSPSPTPSDAPTSIGSPRRPLAPRRRAPLNSSMSLSPSRSDRSRGRQPKRQPFARGGIDSSLDISMDSQPPSHFRSPGRCPPTADGSGRPAPAHPPSPPRSPKRPDLGTSSPMQAPRSRRPPPPIEPPPPCGRGRDYVRDSPLLKRYNALAGGGRSAPPEEFSHSLTERGGGLGGSGATTPRTGSASQKGSTPRSTNETLG